MRASKLLGKFVNADAGLFENAAQCARIDLAVHRHNTAAIAASQDGMAAALPQENKSEPFQGVDGAFT